MTDTVPEDVRALARRYASIYDHSRHSIDMFTAALEDTILADRKARALSGPEGVNPAAAILDHKWLSPVCVTGGCQSLVLTNALKKLAFAAMTSGGTAGPDEGLKAAIDVATAALATQGANPNDQ